MALSHRHRVLWFCAHAYPVGHSALAWHLQHSVSNRRQVYGSASIGLCHVELNQIQIQIQFWFWEIV